MRHDSVFLDAAKSDRTHNADSPRTRGAFRPLRHALLGRTFFPFHRKRLKRRGKKYRLHVRRTTSRDNTRPRHWSGDTHLLLATNTSVRHHRRVSPFPRAAFMAYRASGPAARPDTLLQRIFCMA